MLCGHRFEGRLMRQIPPTIRWTVLTLSLALVACQSVPRDAPPAAAMKGDAAASAEATSSFRYAFVKLGAAQADQLNRLSGPLAAVRSFPVASAAPEMLRLRPGDIVAATIFETSPDPSAQGLFVDGGAAPHANPGATLPNQQIDAQGLINVPFAGAVRVAGLTPRAAGAAIAARLEKRAFEPQVVVAIVDRRADQVSVLGDVNQPTHFPLDPGGLTLLDAIARAGGMKSQAFETEVVLRREGATYSAPLDDLLRRTRDVRLGPGDVVFLVRKPRFVSVFGATTDVVNTPVNHRVLFEADSMTLSEALAKVNGLSDARADPHQVFVLRPLPRRSLGAFGVDAAPFADGLVPTVFGLDLGTAEGLFAASRLNLQPQDVIVAADSGWTDVVKLFGDLNVVEGPFVGGAQMRNYLQ
jgi:polysaccharide export outer membrane protein